MNNQIKKDIAPIEWLVFILLALFGMEEVLTCVAVKIHATFEFFYRASGVVAVLTAITVIAFLAITLKRYLDSKNEDDEEESQYEDAVLARNSPLMWGIAAGLFAICASYIFIFDSFWGNDQTLEYMYSAKDRLELFAINPATGQFMEHGIFPKYKFAALPYFYAVVARLTRINPEILIQYVVPSVILVLYLLMCYRLGKLFFNGRKARSVFFLIIVMILMATGDIWKYTAAYGVFHEGWKGHVIVGALIIPFVCIALYRGIYFKQRTIAIVAIITAVSAAIFIRQLKPPILLIFNRGQYGNQIGLYFGLLLLLATLRFKYVKPERQSDWVIHIVFIVCMLFAYDGLMYPAIAYTACSILDEVGKYRDKTVLVLGGIIMLLFAGSILPWRSLQPVRSTDECMNWVQQAIDQVDNPCFAGDNEVMLKARRMTGCRLPYGQDMWDEEANTEVADVYEEEARILFQAINAGEADARLIGLLAKSAKCNVLCLGDRAFALTAQEAWDEGDADEKRQRGLNALDEQGWELFTRQEGYTIFVKRSANGAN